MCAAVKTMKHRKSLKQIKNWLHSSRLVENRNEFSRKVNMLFVLLLLYYISFYVTAAMKNSKVHRGFLLLYKDMFNEAVTALFSWNCRSWRVRWPRVSAHASYTDSRVQQCSLQGKLHLMQ